MNIYVGIDVACARSKRLPLCAVERLNDKLTPIEIPRTIIDECPRGLGNIEILASRPFRIAALSVSNILQQIGPALGRRIGRIAIDAPSIAPKSATRRCEDEMTKLGLSSFRTPPIAEWKKIKQQCVRHLSKRLPLARLPYANKIWMLYGFELFDALRSEDKFEVIETYPYAVVSGMIRKCPHKSTNDGYRIQLKAVAEQTGWNPDILEQQLSNAVPGSRHDRLDAFMAAWVASMPPKQRRAYGDYNDPDDSIWVPRLNKNHPSTV